MAGRIEQLLNEILNAMYGADVRDAIHDSIEECYSDVSSSKTIAIDAAALANTAASNANAKASVAQDAIDDINDILDDAETAVADANTAAASANAAATSANSAAAAARSATEDIDDIVESATTAASEASAAASDASTAVTNANAALTQANAAITNANSAVTSATTAATAATNAAASANSAATNANSKAELANTAASNANNKATAADLAAASAIAARDSIADSVARAEAAADSITAARDSAVTAAANANAAASAANGAATQATTAASNAASAATSVASAVNDCQAATYNANAAANSASTAASRVNESVEIIDNLTVSSEDVGSSSASGVEMSILDGHKNIHFRLKQGEPGHPYTIKGHAYATIDALEADIVSPEVGDLYNVGSEAPYHVYRWTGTAWEDQGEIGTSVESITNSEIDTIWNDTAISSLANKFLNHTGLFHLIVNKIKTALGNKVDKVSGKGLSQNDFTNDHVITLGNHSSQIAALESTKVSKLPGKGLSTNDFTDEYRNRINQNMSDISELNSTIVETLMSIPTFIYMSTTLSSLPYTISDSRITSDMRVSDVVFGTPEAMSSGLSWSTANGSVTFSGTMVSGKTTTIDFYLLGSSYSSSVYDFTDSSNDGNVVMVRSISG